eukprot:TRINITY_DN12190_c0_g1_i1.p1 TRINITY_DN12190_c0_g1~~TRINITY_DN12190_c0_g1_i1.p1  ORF type:complete len:269 (+),score=39.23 TRINITY_DN12190_c0_g1_i1:96-902(+)
MRSSVKAGIARTYGESGLDEDQFVKLCQSAGYICSTFTEKDACHLFQQLRSSARSKDGRGRMSIRHMDSALDRIAAMRLGHLERFVTVCSRMITDGEFRRRCSQLSFGDNDSLDKLQQQNLPPFPPEQLAEFSSRARRPRGSTQQGETPQEALRETPSGFTRHISPSEDTPAALAVLGRPGLAKLKPTFSAAAIAQSSILRSNGEKVLADKVHKSPWGGGANPDPDYFVAEGYYPGKMFRQTLRKSASTPAGFETSQLLVKLLSDAQP